MSQSGRLQADPLFQGLTRPAMILGVTYTFFALNATLCLILFIQTSNFIVLLFTAPVIHCVGYLLCMKEPRAIDLMILHLGKGMRCMNRIFHGNTNSYDIY